MSEVLAGQMFVKLNVVFTIDFVGALEFAY